MMDILNLAQNGTLQLCYYSIGALNAFYVQGDLIELVFPSQRSMSTASL